MAVDGPIALAARGIIPETWDALANSSYFGDTLLGVKRDYVKYVLFGTVVMPSIESTVYNPIITEYAAKGLAITLIPAGADYYANKLQTMTATGTNESRTYPDRIANLWNIHARLLGEMEDLRRLANIPGGFTRNRAVPINSGSGVALLSGDPQQFWALHATTWERGLGSLPWDRWTGPVSA